MSYRKITVDGKQYEYVIGKTHTKIKGLGLFLNTEIGMTVPFPPEFHRAPKTFVTPGMIADKIQGKLPRKPIMYSCEHLTTPHTVADPFESEVHGRYVAMIACDRCVNERSWDI